MKKPKIKLSTNNIDKTILQLKAGLKSSERRTTLAHDALNYLALKRLEKEVAEIKELVGSIFDKVSDIFYKRNE